MAVRLPSPLFALGQTVYLRIPSDLVGQINGVLYRPGNVIVYMVRWSDATESEYWASELTEEREYRATEETP